MVLKLICWRVMVLKLICWRVLCGFKDILRGKSNEVRCVTVKGHAVWSLVNGVWEWK